MIAAYKLAGVLNDAIAKILAYFLIVIFSGYLQAYIAKRLGDRTAEDAGYLSLHPLVYFDPIGFVLFFLTGFGWSRPVPINPQNFTGRHRRLEALFAYSSPAFANAVLAFLMMFIVTTTLGGFSQTIPVPAFLISHPAVKKAFGLVMFRMAIFAIYFTFFSLLLGLFRATALIGFAKFDVGEWHEAELISLLIAIALLYLFEGPINFVMQFIILGLEGLIWHWWSWFATALGFISMYQGSS